MISHKDILKLLRSRRKKPLNRRELHRHFAKEDPQTLNRLLDELESQGTIVRVKGERYAVPGELGLIVGRLEVNPRGFGFVTPEEGGSEDIYIHSENMSTALDGDKVLIRFLEERRRRRGRPSRSGQVVRVLERGSDLIVGTLTKSGSLFYLLPDNPSFIHDIAIAPDKMGGGRPGEKVTVRITDWPSRHVSPEGEVVEVLGVAGLPKVDTIAVIRQHGLREDYPPEVLKEAAKIPQQISLKEIEGREDLREKTIFTVDPDDARDFDDAISLEKTTDGNWELGVHITDVSHYVKAETPLGEEARLRGTSVYFPAHVLHMLPPSLSTGICSLRPGEERLTVSVFLTFSPEGERLGSRFSESVIKSSRRYTYGEVRKIVLEKDEEARSAEPELTSVLDDLAALACRIREVRFARGALDLDLPEAKIVFDREGRIARVELEEQDLAHWVIEECMLAANEAVAEFLGGKAPLIYRVHDKPDDRDLQEFVAFVSAFGYEIKNPKDRKEIQSFVDSVKDTPLCTTLQTAFLRSLKRAEYSAKNIGHYGLAAKAYVYFTSPIRRYPDLYTHRLIKQVLRGEKPKGEAEMKRLALHCTETERDAEEAEREVVQLRKLQFFEQELSGGEGKTFKAVITKIKDFGIVVYLNNYLIGGLVHVSTLTDDFYRADRSGTKLKGRRTGRQFRVGSVIKVSVEKVDLIKKQVDFLIA